MQQQGIASRRPFFQIVDENPSSIAWDRASLISKRSRLTMAAQSAED
jgi:hypothetical protein